jgi:hypothetical protein
MNFSYLTGDQITSNSQPEGYISAIMKGARLLECKVIYKVFDLVLCI